MYRGMNKFKKGYQSRTTTAEDKKVICLQTPTVLGIGRRIISISYKMYMEGTMLDRLEYTLATSVWAQFLWDRDGYRKASKIQITNQVLIKLQQKVGQCILSSKNLLFLFGIGKNWLCSEMSHSSYLFIRIIEAYQLLLTTYKMLPNFLLST